MTLVVRYVTGLPTLSDTSGSTHDSLLNGSKRASLEDTFLTSTKGLIMSHKNKGYSLKHKDSSLVTKRAATADPDPPPVNLHQTSLL